MTVSKSGRVPKTIKEAVQEQFSRMGESYTVSMKWKKSESVAYFSVFRELPNEPEPIIYTFAIHGDEIRYTSCDVNTCEATQLSLAYSEDAFFQFMFKCDLPLDFDTFTEIMRLISLYGLDVTAFYK
ncbi:TPA: hypothetical protein OT044_000471 [Citrobacter koseri]|uniref:Uncharacterized protein n=1 Tax=Citrobacter koseri TaxID=545 RepID=A0A447UU59_CITKO|nr:hypothetical protein [Citrobacter sp. CK194]VEB94214.1 Uncharacterised protein [Citrobacter koseri]MDM3025358.1 hypothetical protein [Citrobacter sp. CK194]VFS10044.1 Uncharacterised protein [Citrobacter koseri]HAU5600968.1 hypothetical protein [Citrobacter koseri]HCT5366364.1 hypothetical protein [Citrobacter koseri]